MVGLPRVTKLGANLGRSDDVKFGSGNQHGSDCNVASNKRVIFAPRLSLREVLILDLRLRLMIRISQKSEIKNP